MGLRGLGRPASPPKGYCQCPVPMLDSDLDIDLDSGDDGLGDDLCWRCRLPVWES